MSISRHIARFFRLLLRITITLCVLVAAAWLFVQTGPGRRVLAQQLSKAISSDSFSILIEDIRDVSLTRAAAGRVVLADAGGPWLEIRDAQATWNPWALRDSRVEIHELRAASVRMDRIPDSDNTATNDPGRKRSEYQITVDDVAIGDVGIGSPVSVITVGLRDAAGCVTLESGADAFSLNAAVRAATVSLDSNVLSQADAKVALSVSESGWKLSGIEVHCDGAEVPGVVTGGIATVSAEIEGGNGQGVLTARASVKSLSVREMHAETAGADGTLRWSADAPHPLVMLRTRVSGVSAGSLIVSNGSLRAEGALGNLAVSAQVSGSAPAPIAVDAAGRVAWESGRASVELASATVDYAGIHARLTGPFSVLRDADRTSISGKVDLAETDLLGGLVRAHVEAHGDVATADVTADVTLSGGNAGACVVSDAVLRVTGRLSRPSLSVAASGSCRFPFALRGDGAGEWSEARKGVEFTTASLDIAGIHAALADPLQVFFDQERSWIHADVRVNDMVLSALPHLESLGGRVRAGISVDGELARPVARGTLAIEGLVARRGDLGEMPPLDGDLQCTYSNNVLAMRAFIATSAWGHASGQVAAPIVLSLWPFDFRLLKENESSLGVDAEFDLRVLNNLPSFHESRIGGRMDVRVGFTGNEAGGSARGECRLSDGEYENFVSGTVLRKAQAHLVSSGERLVIESASATDGGAGRISAEGHVGLVPGSAFPYRFHIGFKDARCVRRPDADATLSGKLSIEGDVHSARVDGDVRVDAAQIRLDYVRRAPPAVLDSIATPETATGRTNAASIMPGLTLRLGIDIPGSLDIRGRSLESVWGGRVDVGLTGGVLRLAGYVEPRRGTFLFLKRSFKLAEGRIEFDGGWPPAPSLRLAATHNRSDVSATLVVAGNLDAPSITLTSEPPMPTDEILARVLFGKDMASVSPLQAIELASAATSLKTGGGPDFLGQARNAAGIDRIEIRDSDSAGGGTEVAAGKYLGDRTYVEMKRTGGEQAGVGFSMEYELHPRVTLEADSGVDMRSGVGVYWKLDY